MTVKSYIELPEAVGEAVEHDLAIRSIFRFVPPMIPVTASVEFALPVCKPHARSVSAYWTWLIPSLTQTSQQKDGSDETCVAFRSPRLFSVRRLPDAFADGAPAMQDVRPGPRARAIWPRRGRQPASVTGLCAPHSQGLQPANAAGWSADRSLRLSVLHRPRPARFLPERAVDNRLLSGWHRDGLPWGSLHE